MVILENNPWQEKDIYIIKLIIIWTRNRPLRSKILFYIHPDIKKAYESGQGLRNISNIANLMQTTYIKLAHSYKYF